MIKAKTKSLQLYYDTICNEKPLSQEEEIKLFKMVKNGNKKAKELIIRANLKFVIKIAFHYVNQGVDIEDLINEGNIGLINAIDEFDQNKGVKFISFAVWKIRCYILILISQQSRSISYSVGYTDRVYVVRKIYNKLYNKFNRNPEPYEVLNVLKIEKPYMNMTEKQVAKLLTTPDQTLSFDEPILKNTNKMSLYDVYYQQSDCDNILDCIIEKEKKTIIKNAISQLTDRERKIINMYFGLNGNIPTLIKDIKKNLEKDYKVAIERVRQVRVQALKKIEKKLKQHRCLLGV